MTETTLYEGVQFSCESYESGAIDSMEYMRNRYLLISAAAKIGALDGVREKLYMYESKWRQEGSTVYMPLDEEVTRYYLQFVKSDPLEAPFVYLRQNGGYAVLPTVLKDYIFANNRFLFVGGQNGGTSAVYRYFLGVYRRVGEEDIKRIIKETVTDYSPTLYTMQLIQNVYNDIMCETKRIDPNQLNADERYVNLKNGLLDLETFELNEHTPSLFSTVQLDANFTENPNPERFMKFLHELTGGDREKIILILQCMGAVFSNINCSRFKKAMFMVGKGNTGKSVLRELINRLVGRENCSAVELSSLENDRFASSQLYNKRIAGTSDLNYNSVHTMSQFKLITGGDSIVAQFKGKPQFEFIFKGLLWFSMNELPRFAGDKGSWVYKRMAIIRCAEPKPANERDPNLIEKLMEEKDDIISLCLKHIAMVAANGYRLHEVNDSEQALKSYEIINSPELHFLSECTKIRTAEPLPTDHMNATVMFEIFKQWCRDNEPGYKPKKGDFKNYAMLYYDVTPKELLIHKNYGYYYCFTLNESASKEYEGRFLNKTVYHPN